jgi:hypothetical protein
MGIPGDHVKKVETYQRHACGYVDMGLGNSLTWCTLVSRPNDKPSTENPLQASCSAGHTITQGVAIEVESG